MVVTKDSQDVAAARRVAANRINLPRRSLRTVGRGIVFRRFVALGAAASCDVRCFAVGSLGGLGFGGLAGSSAWGCRWPTHHNNFSKKA